MAGPRKHRVQAFGDVPQETKDAMAEEARAEELTQVDPPAPTPARSPDPIESRIDEAIDVAPISPSLSGYLKRMVTAITAGLMLFGLSWGDAIGFLKDNPVALRYAIAGAAVAITYLIGQFVLDFYREKHAHELTQMMVHTAAAKHLRRVRLTPPETRNPPNPVKENAVRRGIIT